MSFDFAITFFQFWIFAFLFILISELVLSILNILPTFNFKWSIRFLWIGKLIMTGVLFLFYHLLQKEAWFNA